MTARKMDAPFSLVMTNDMRDFVHSKGGAAWLRRVIGRNMPNLPGAANKPRSQERYEAIGKLYQSGEKIVSICAELNVTEGTVMRAARALGLPRRIRGRKPGRAA